MHKALDAAVRKGLLTSNPVDLADKVSVPEKDATEAVWSPEDVTRFLEATRTDRLYPIWHLACWTGLRRSELCGLQWRDIDLDLAVLSVRRARVEVDGRVIDKGPKSAASRRIVDLDGETVAVLRQWKVAQLEERLRGTALGTRGLGLHEPGGRAMAT